MISRSRFNNRFANYMYVQLGGRDVVDYTFSTLDLDYAVPESLIGRVLRSNVEQVGLQRAYLAVQESVRVASEILVSRHKYRDFTAFRPTTFVQTGSGGMARASHF